MRILLLSALCLGLIGCGQQGDSSGAETAVVDITETVNSINVADLKADIAILASDEFEGRAPSSPGEEKTINFLKDEFTRLGLQPGNGDSFFQEVPLVESKADPNTTLKVSVGGKNHSFAYGEDMMVWTKKVADKGELKDSEMIFVGYGIVAPEYSWNDYEGLDVAGKTVVILVNDPGYATQDAALFNGNAMTYYGRWTYKFEEAARQGAAGALIIHEDAPAGYPWAVVSGSWSGPQFDLVGDGSQQRLEIEGWISSKTAGTIFGDAGKDLAALKTAAMKQGFKWEAIGAKASLTLKNEVKQSTSRNVIAVWPGEERKDEYVFYCAHWDHLGKDESLEGDQIYNGAIDNASGTAALLEIAEAFTQLPKRQARSIVFLAVTAEEKGLLGSRYYGENPIYPTNKSVAAINMDALNTIGKTKDVVVVGYGNSELDDYLKDAAADMGRTLKPDPTPEKGFFYRSDHLNFAKQGIPALYAEGGNDHETHGEEWGAEKAANYTAHHYHKPSDEMTDDWDLSGAIQDLQMLYRVGYRLATENVWPNWREGNEFRAIRDKDRPANK